MGNSEVRKEMQQKMCHTCTSKDQGNQDLCHKLNGTVHHRLCAAMFASKKFFIVGDIGEMVKDNTGIVYKEQEAGPPNLLK